MPRLRSHRLTLSKRLLALHLLFVFEKGTEYERGTKKNWAAVVYVCPLTLATLFSFFITSILVYLLVRNQLRSCCGFLTLLFSCVCVGRANSQSDKSSHSSSIILDVVLQRPWPISVRVRVEFVGASSSLGNGSVCVQDVTALRTVEARGGEMMSTPIMWRSSASWWWMIRDTMREVSDSSRSSSSFFSPSPVASLFPSLFSSSRRASSLRNEQESTWWVHCLLITQVHFAKHCPTLTVTSAHRCSIDSDGAYNGDDDNDGDGVEEVEGWGSTVGDDRCWHNSGRHVCMVSTRATAVGRYIAPSPSGSVAWFYLLLISHVILIIATRTYYLQHGKKNWKVLG